MQRAELAVPPDDGTAYSGHHAMRRRPHARKHLSKGRVVEAAEALTGRPVLMRAWVIGTGVLYRRDAWDSHTRAEK